MKPTTGKLLLDVVRNLKGILTVFERWVRQESHIGSVSIASQARSDSTSDGDGPTDSTRDSG